MREIALPVRKGRALMISSDIGLPEIAYVRMSVGVA